MAQHIHIAVFVRGIADGIGGQRRVAGYVDVVFDIAPCPRENTLHAHGARFARREGDVRHYLVVFGLDIDAAGRDAIRRCVPPRELRALVHGNGSLRVVLGDTGDTADGVRA